MLQWLFVAALICASQAFKILVVFPMPSKSHGILGEGVVRNLLNAGHEVTFITPFPVKNPKPNLRQLQVSSVFEQTSMLNLKAIMDKEATMNPTVLFATTRQIQINTINNESVQKLLNDPKETFDLVIAEWMFSEIYSGFAAVFNCPYIWLYPGEPSSLGLSLIDDRMNPSYNPGFTSSNAPPFSFLQRAKELGIHVFVTLLKNFYFRGKESETYEELYGPIMKKKGRPLPPFDVMKYNASLMLGNSHVSVGAPVRLPQSYKPVRGYHIDPDVKPLPENLQKIFDDAKNGLVYFSMGSNLQSKDMDNELKKRLLKAFGELKQTVLWKFEDNLQDLPKNVHIVQWAPQTSILAHPNCILFITHGGGLSTTETVFFGKPIIGIPVFGDQFGNVDLAVQKGFGIRVELDYNLPENLKKAINEIVNNPRYMTKAKEASFVYHHRPVPPGAELVHWVEHVIQTGGAPHLRSYALLVPFYQKYFLDLVAVLAVTFYVLYLALKFICKRMCKKNKANVKQKSN